MYARTRRAETVPPVRKKGLKRAKSASRRKPSGPFRKAALRRHYYMMLIYQHQMPLQLACTFIIKSKNIRYQLIIKHTVRNVKWLRGVFRKIYFLLKNDFPAHLTAPLISSPRIPCRISGISSYAFLSLQADAVLPGTTDICGNGSCGSP